MVRERFPKKTSDASFVYIESIPRVLEAKATLKKGRQIVKRVKNNLRYPPEMGLAA
jgi:hypothetical protein